MRCQIVGNHNITGLERRGQLGFKIRFKRFAGHGPVKNPRRDHGIVAQAGDKCGCLPVTAGRMIEASRTAPGAAAQAGHVCARGRFIKKNKL